MKKKQKETCHEEEYKIFTKKASTIEPSKPRMCWDRCWCYRDIIAKALEGNYRKEHLFALAQAYEAYEFFHRQIRECEESIERNLSSLQAEIAPITPVNHSGSSSPTRYARKTQANRSSYYFAAAAAIKKITVADLTTIPGIDANIAMKILSEIGTDTSRWPNAKAFTSWLGLCPGNKISGGKMLSSRTKPSDNKAAKALRMAAFTLYRSKTAIGAFFRRMRARLGAPKAITAAAHKLASLSDVNKRRKLSRSWRKLL